MFFRQAIFSINAFYLKHLEYYQSSSDGQEDWPENWNSIDYTLAYKRTTKDRYLSFDISLYDDIPLWYTSYFIDGVRW